MGPRLGRVEYQTAIGRQRYLAAASMGPRLGRVEYTAIAISFAFTVVCFNGATLRTRGIRFPLPCDLLHRPCFNGATLRTRGITIGAATEDGDNRRLQWGHA